MTSPRTREQWLLDAAELMRPWFHELGDDFPARERLLVSVSFPGGGSRQKTIGECWVPEASESGEHTTVFVSPVLTEETRVLGVLLHELVHASGKRGHKKGFRDLAVGLGLTGKMTATTETPELVATFTRFAERLGPYPHVGLIPAKSTRRKQGTRMLKVTCPESGYLVRMTRTWLDTYGEPICPCHDERMVEA